MREEKIEVYTQFKKPDTVYTEPGNKFLDIFQEQIGKDGAIEVVPVGKKNVYDEIQLDLEGTKIENILHAVAMGDLNAIHQRECFYVDATTMPKNLMEAQNIVVRAKEEFYNMPVEIRELFNNSPEKYVSEMGTKEFLDKLAPYNEKISKIREAGSVEEYNKRVAEQAKFEKDVEAAKGVVTE